MARPRNLEGRREVRNAAFTLFYQKGYIATSYSDIAAAIGKERAVVQSFYPKKKVLVERLLYILARGCLAYAEQEKLLTEDPANNLLAAGQLYFGYLFRDQNAIRFTKEILEDRNTTVQSLTFNEEWLETFIGETEVHKKKYLDAFFFCMGGGYKLLFQSVNDGSFSTDDILPINKMIVQSFAVISGLFAWPDESELVVVTPELHRSANAFLTEWIFASPAI